jgi:putative FmdB family regulatory protein
MAEAPETMPTYEYACKTCGEHLEVVQSFKDDALTTCPACGGPLRKVFGSIGIAFKGSGFYRTDSRSGPPKEKEKEKEKKAAASEGSSSTEKSSGTEKPSTKEKSSGAGGEKSSGSGSGATGGEKAAKSTTSTAASA